MSEFTKEQLEKLKIAYWNLLQNKRELAGPWEHDAFNLAVFAIALMERAENAEAERDRLKKELEEATACGPHYIRDSRLRAEGMRAAAEIARNLRPKDACTCGNYLSFRNGVPGHLPGCLVGECVEVADEIEGRAEEIDRSNRE